ncbi:hypothetical protein C3B47_14180 [Flavobacterium columnare]|uniref:hypothetical protein n=1 Tax=Flavobacterium TaxID=237 RepID=UPI0018965903|nr:hypothetical protein [Flavobacterium columnare]MBF6654002.1 hypothetical protein [Flavobacterium columnare]MBF6655058.1 hypothetical protein [Flavobacterium columnare]
MSILKEYRVVGLMDTSLNPTNQRVLVAELAEVQYKDLTFSNGQKLYTFPESGNKFVVDFNSKISNYLINSEKDEEIVKIDLSNFRLNTNINQQGERIEVYYHNDLYTGANKTKLLSNLTKLKLERAFLNIQNPKELLNSIIISILNSSDNSATIYLIGKFEDEEIYVGIVETEFTEKREIQKITLDEINELGDFKEVQSTPFYTKEFLTGNIVYCK